MNFLGQTFQKLEYYRQTDTLIDAFAIHNNKKTAWQEKVNL